MNYRLLRLEDQGPKIPFEAKNGQFQGFSSRKIYR